MAWSLVWSDKAKGRFFDEIDWLKGRSLAGAARFVERVQLGTALLVDNPDLAPIWDQYPDLGVRRMVIGKYLLYYELHEGPKEILVLTIRHAREPVPEPDEVR